MMLRTSKQGHNEAKSHTVSQQIEAPANSKAQETVDHLLYNKEFFLIIKLLQSSYSVKQRVDRLFYMV